MREGDSIDLYGGRKCSMGTDEVKVSKEEEEVRREDD